MKTVELQSFGLDGLRTVERPDPEPAAGEVLVRIEAVSLNYRDLEIIEGRYAMPVTLPRVPLSDAVGRIEALGPGVAGWAVGERVCPIFLQDWTDGPFHERFFQRQLGGSIDGVFRQRMALPAASLVRAPAHLGLEAASLPIAALTAWSAWQDAGLRPGQTALVIGTGGVSLFGVQLARLFGAEIIVVGGEAAGLACATGLGARAVINRRETPAWGGAVRRLTGGEGVDAVLDVAGSATFAQLPEALRMGGTVAMVGYASGARLDFDLRALFIARRARLHGHTVGSRRDFEALCRALEAHRSRPVIDAVYAWDEAPAALARLRSGQAVGKILIEL